MNKNRPVMPFQSGHYLANLVVLFLALGILADAAAATSSFWMINMMSRLSAAQFATDEEIAALEGSSACIGLFQLVAFACTAIMFLWWIHRAHRNLTALRAANLRFSPGWAVAYWFIPILFLFRPYQVMKEIWQGSDPKVDASEGTSWKNAPASSLMPWWWASWLLTSAIGRVAFSMTSRAVTPDQIAASAWTSVASDLLSIVGALLLAAIVGRIDRNQRDKRLVLENETRGTSVLQAPQSQMPGGEQMVAQSPEPGQG